MKYTLLENIYDVVKACALPEDTTHDDDWVELSRKHAKQAQAELYEFLQDKQIQWDGDNNRITIWSDETGECYCIKQV